MSTPALRVLHGLPTDQRLSFGTEWGFMGFLDPDAYQPDLGLPRRGDQGRAWTPEAVLHRGIESMNAEKAFFWGYGEVNSNLIFNPTDFDSWRGKASRSFIGYVKVTKGRLCLTCDHTLAGVAQYPEQWSIPMPEDVVWMIDPGLYSIEVLQLFAYDGKDQLPSDQDPRYEAKAIHYALRITPAGTSPQTKYDKIPVQPSYYRM